MQAISRAVHLIWDALFLQHRAYETMRDDDNPFVEGLFILVLLGVFVALVGIVGVLFEWGSSPNLGEIQEVVFDNLRQMPWYEQMQTEGGQQAVDIFTQIWNTNWQIVQALVPTPLTALAGIVTKPLGLIIAWLVFGVIAHALARLFGGTGNLGQTLGTTALAASPQLIIAVGALPFVAVAGVGTWTMLCRYMALRTAHDLSWPRAVWATILPPIIIGLVLGILATLGFIAFGATLAALFTGGQ
jgi:hypothetical protein